MPTQTSEDILHTVYAIVADVTNTDPSELWSEALLIEDLNITEDAIRIIVRQLNKEFDISLSLTDILEEAETLTLLDLATYASEEVELG